MGITINHKKSLKALPRKVTAARRFTQGKAPCITTILSSESWKGKTCFLLGGGPSLKGFDFNLIKNFPTIGVNKSFITYSTDILYAMDNCFYDMVTSESNQRKKLYQQWLAFRGIKVFLRHSKKIGFAGDIYVVTNLRSKVLSFNLSHGIYGGNNSGFGALMLAIGLGCTRIGLLGYDLKIKKEGPKVITHWHGGYSRGNVNTFQGKLDKFRKCFEEFAPTFAKQKIDVVNLNLDSALKCFPKEDVKTFLK